MTEGFETLEGWFTLHDFRILDWALWSALSDTEKKEIKEEFFSLLSRFGHIEDRRQGSFGLFDIIGHKADFLFVHLRESLDELAGVEREFNKTRLAHYTTPCYSYVSAVELSNYVVNHEKTAEVQSLIEARLKPILPKTKHVCFYPMNKRREGTDNNWYMLSIDERRRMMKSHGMLGRQYAGKVTQMIGGSIGLDDWEWGVTLFADDPLVFKHIVTDMRFDEVSARFGEFGGFYVGNRLSQEQLVKILS